MAAILFASDKSSASGYKSQAKRRYRDAAVGNLIPRLQS